MNKSIRTFTLAALVAFSLPVMANAAVDDQSLYQAVQKQTIGHISFFDDVNATVKNGVVELTGRVTSSSKVREIEQAVAGVAGIKSVKNNLVDMSQFGS